MCQVRPGLRGLEIDPITARAIGWQDADADYHGAALLREETQFALLAQVIDPQKTAEVAKSQDGLQ